MELKTLQTKLETASIEEISAVLDWKASEVGASGTADYIARAIENIDSGITRIDDAIKELNAIKKDMKSQQETIKIGASKWLSDNGIEKLQGDRISSIIVSPKTEKIELIVTNEEACINAGHFKTVIDKTSLKQALLDGANIDGAELEVTYSEDTLRVSKRKTLKVD